MSFLNSKSFCFETKMCSIYKNGKATVKVVYCKIGIEKIVIAKSST
jgi:hypothetical protein